MQQQAIQTWAKQTHWILASFLFLLGSTQAQEQETWMSTDVGYVQVQGETDYQEAEGKLTLKGEGIGISNFIVDGFHYLYQPVIGDFEMALRITGISGGPASATAALLFRENLDAISSGIQIEATQGLGLFFRARSGFLQTPQVLGSAGGNLPVWIKLNRKGNQISSFHSIDGSNWIPLGIQKTFLPSFGYLGLVASSTLYNNTLSRITADSVTTQGAFFRELTSPWESLNFNSNEELGISRQTTFPEGANKKQFLIQASGVDSSDNEQFHFTCQQVEGDFQEKGSGYYLLFKRSRNSAEKHIPRAL